jgi:hypothetical protein
MEKFSMKYFINPGDGAVYVVHAASGKSEQVKGKAAKMRAFGLMRRLVKAGERHVSIYEHATPDAAGKRIASEGAVKRNPAKRRKLAATLTKRTRRRKVSAIHSASDPVRGRHTVETAMAKRARKRRRKASTSAAPRRRRRRVLRRNPGAFARLRSNPRKRRRRRSVAVATRSTRRRRYRRNPGLGGVVGTIVQGLKDGGAVVGGQVAARKIRGAVTGLLPADMQAKVRTGVGHIALSIASAVTVSLVTKRFLPGYSRMVAAGAFSEAINAALAQTPVAPFLGAFPARRVVAAPVNGGRRGVNAWSGASALPPAAPRGVGAWSRQVGMPTMVQV